MDYTDVQYLKSYVEFLGDQADRLVFLLDNDSKVELDVYGEGLAINIFPDGNILSQDHQLRWWFETAPPGRCCGSA